MTLVLKIQLLNTITRTLHCKQKKYFADVAYFAYKGRVKFEDDLLYEFQIEKFLSSAKVCKRATISKIVKLFAIYKKEKK